MNLPESKQMPPGFNTSIQRKPLPIIDLSSTFALRPLPELPNKNAAITIILAVASATVIAAITASSDPSPRKPQQDQYSTTHSAKK